MRLITLLNGNRCRSTERANNAKHCPLGIGPRASRSCSFTEQEETHKGRDMGAFWNYENILGLLCAKAVFLLAQSACCSPRLPSALAHLEAVPAHSCWHGLRPRPSSGRQRTAASQKRGPHFLRVAPLVRRKKSRRGFDIGTDCQVERDIRLNSQGSSMESLSFIKMPP